MSLKNLFISNIARMVWSSLNDEPVLILGCKAGMLAFDE